MSLVVGLMSGTSLDGIDAALVDFSATPFQTRLARWTPYPSDIRSQALALQAAGDNELHRGAVLANQLAVCYAKAVHSILAEAGLAAGQIAAIGCHGQTVRHQPACGYSIQLNNPALLAELSGIPVVADFRSRDIAAGGQGAPLVPAYHAAVFGDRSEHRVIVNIGGIANLTNLHPGLPVSGFDCGPGNMLLDAWIERHDGATYDRDGRWAASGKVLPELLEALLGFPFFSAPPPKSCGRDEFNLAWLEQHLRGGHKPEDVQATLLELSAVSIAKAIARWCGKPQRVLVCGGGGRNLALMGRLRSLLQPAVVDLTDAFGQPADSVEAVAFAWLAWQTLCGRPGNLPEVTGSRHARVLGAIYPR